ncbi:MAG: hypothetical protein L0099_14875 [Acidobacteria bacterium]|nr:hypothetical protein [Acidobacteriota bacterium]
MKLTQVRNSALAVVALAVLAVAVSVLSGGPAHAFQGIPRQPSIPIGAGNVTLTADQIGEAPSVIRAFVPTGSASPKCLVTFADSPNAATAGQTVYCGHRVQGGMDGLMITVLHPGDLPSDALIIVTVYQERAMFYGSPLPFTGQ